MRKCTLLALRIVLFQISKDLSFLSLVFSCDKHLQCVFKIFLFLLIYSVHVQSVCDAVDVPHLETHPRLDLASFYRAEGEFANVKVSPSNSQIEQRFSSINVHPKLEDINNAYLDFIGTIHIQHNQIYPTM